MTAPGSASDESGHDNEPNPPPPGESPPEQRPWSAPWDSPASPPAAGYPPAGPQFGGPPSGYGSPSHPAYPGGHYPPPQYQGYQPEEPVQPGMNGLAVAALISSFTGVLCFVGGIAAIVLGAIALNQIKRTRQDGYALAVAGIVIGIATLIVSLVVAIFALHSI